MRKGGSGLLALCSLLLGCTARPPEKPSARPPEVLVTPAVQETIVDWEEFSGRTEAKNTIEIKTRVTGYLDKVHFKDGDTVEEGQLLFEIDPRPYLVELEKGKASVAQTESKFKRVEADFQRAQVMKQSKAISPEDFDKVQGEYREANAAIAVARANLEKAKLDLVYTKVKVPNLNNGREPDPKHPRTGRVSRRMKDPGNLIKADETVLTTIVTLDPMYVTFDVDERTVLGMRSLIEKKKIKSINEMTLRFELANDDGKFPYHGKINFEDNKLDTGTGTLQLRGEFTNNKGLAPGLFVRLRLLLGSSRPVVMVPERALGTDQGQKFLYVVKQETDKDGKPAFKAEYRAGNELELGALRDGRRVIEKGVAAGEMVIFSGLQRVRKDAYITPKQENPDNPKAK